MNLAAISPLDALELAKVLSVDVWTPHQLSNVPKEVCRRLLNRHARVWSAVTVSHGRRHLIVYNPTHSRARRNSDLMHEMAHLLLEHQPTQVFISPQSGYALRTHDKNQESEAGWLTGSLLLPRPALLRIRRQGLDHEEACDEYGVSQDLLLFRMNVTGVNIQFRRIRT